MWKIAIRGALIYLLFINLIIIVLLAITKGQIDRDIYIWFGILGTLLVMLSLGYLPIKYYFKSANTLKTWLHIHMVAGGLGAFLILLHSELYLRSVLPAAALITMELVAFTGLLGRFLFIYSMQELHKEKVINKAKVDEKENGDYVLLALSADTLKGWRKIHVQFTWLLLLITILHVITEFYWRGLRL